MRWPNHIAYWESWKAERRAPHRLRFDRPDPDEPAFIVAIASLAFGATSTQAEAARQEAPALYPERYPWLAATSSRSDEAALVSDAATVNLARVDLGRLTAVGETAYWNRQASGPAACDRLAALATAPGDPTDLICRAVAATRCARRQGHGGSARPIGVLLEKGARGPVPRWHAVALASELIRWTNASDRTEAAARALEYHWKTEDERVVLALLALAHEGVEGAPAFLHEFHDLVGWDRKLISKAKTNLVAAVRDVARTDGSKTGELDAGRERLGIDPKVGDRSEEWLRAYLRRARSGPYHEAALAALVAAVPKTKVDRWIEAVCFATRASSVPLPSTFASAFVANMPRTRFPAALVRSLSIVPARCWTPDLTEAARSLATEPSTDARAKPLLEELVATYDSHARIAAAVNVAPTPRSPVDVVHTAKGITDDGWPTVLALQPTVAPALIDVVGRWLGAQRDHVMARAALAEADLAVADTGFHPIVSAQLKAVVLDARNIVHDGIKHGSFEALRERASGHGARRTVLAAYVEDVVRGLCREKGWTHVRVSRRGVGDVHPSPPSELLHRLVRNALGNADIHARGELVWVEIEEKLARFRNDCRDPAGAVAALEAAVGGSKRDGLAGALRDWGSDTSSRRRYELTGGDCFLLTVWWA